MATYVWDITGRYKEKMNVGSRGDRAIFGGGQTPSVVNTIEYVNIKSTGDATDFGDLTSSRRYLSGLASPTRGCQAGGNHPSASNVIDYITIASAGDATDFGDFTAGLALMGAASNRVRGIWGCFLDEPSIVTNIDYVTIASTGDAADFGDISTSRYSAQGVSDSHGGL